MMDKLTMAHEYAMQHLENSGGRITMASLLAFAWEYADAMQAEADKRNHIGEPNEMVKEQQPDINSILHSIDCYFDNPHSSKRDANNLIQSIYEGLGGEVKDEPNAEEWQPDWSQAPKDATLWRMGSDRIAIWQRYSDFDADTPLTTICSAPSFDYQGSWQDSLQERPL